MKLLESLSVLGMAHHSDSTFPGTAHPIKVIDPDWEKPSGFQFMSFKCLLNVSAG